MRRIFGPWCKEVGREAELVGVDLPVGASAIDYKQVLGKIRDDPQAAGALITTHKVAVIDHASEFFTGLSDEAKQLGEVSCILKRDSQLFGDTLDPACAGIALARITDPQNRDVLILGAGGAGTALALHLQQNSNCKVHATDRNPERLNKISEFGAIPHAESNDEAVESMRPAAIIVNATGLGKDLPGSPVSADVRWPSNALAWELNYRGDLKFLEYAKQAGVETADGWDYFVLGWSNIMSRVLDFELAPDLQRNLQQIAANLR